MTFQVLVTPIGIESFGYKISHDYITYKKSNQKKIRALKNISTFRRNTKVIP